MTVGGLSTFSHDVRNKFDDDSFCFARTCSALKGYYTACTKQLWDTFSSDPVVSDLVQSQDQLPDWKIPAAPEVRF